MRINLFLLSVALIFIIASCHKEGPTIQNNNDEKILTISHKILIGYGFATYLETKLILDTTYATFQNRLGYDSSGNPLPDTDTTFSITTQQWNDLISSFNLDSLMALDTLYINPTDEKLITLEITTTQRYKKIMYDKSRLFLDTLGMLAPIDSIDKRMLILREGLW